MNAQAKLKATAQTIISEYDKTHSIKNIEIDSLKALSYTEWQTLIRRKPEFSQLLHHGYKLTDKAKSHLLFSSPSNWKFIKKDKVNQTFLPEKNREWAISRREELDSYNFDTPEYKSLLNATLDQIHPKFKPINLKEEDIDTAIKQRLEKIEKTTGDNYEFPAQEELVKGVVREMIDEVLFPEAQPTDVAKAKFVDELTKLCHTMLELTAMGSGKYELNQDRILMHFEPQGVVIRLKKDSKPLEIELTKNAKTNSLDTHDFRILKGDEVVASSKGNQESEILITNISQVDKAGRKYVQVTEDVYDYSLDAMPPIAWTGNFFAMGDPKSFKNGKPTFYCFDKIEDKFYCTIDTIQDAKVTLSNLKKQDISNESRLVQLKEGERYMIRPSTGGQKNQIIEVEIATKDTALIIKDGQKSGPVFMLAELGMKHDQVGRPAIQLNDLKQQIKTCFIGEIPSVKDSNGNSFSSIIRDHRSGAVLKYNETMDGAKMITEVNGGRNAYYTITEHFYYPNLQNPLGPVKKVHHCNEGLKTAHQKALEKSNYNNNDTSQEFSQPNKTNQKSVQKSFFTILLLVNILLSSCAPEHYWGADATPHGAQAQAKYIKRMKGHKEKRRYLNATSPVWGAHDVSKSKNNRKNH